MELLRCMLARDSGGGGLTLEQAAVWAAELWQVAVHVMYWVHPSHGVCACIGAAWHCAFAGGGSLAASATAYEGAAGAAQCMQVRTCQCTGERSAAHFCRHRGRFKLGSPTCM
jgi:hypothetical protein